MSSPISADILGLIKHRLDASNPQEILRIASAIAANEQIDQLGKAASFSKPTIAGVDIAATGQRFVSVNESETAASKDFPWVYDRTTKLLWARSVLPETYSWAEAKKTCEKVSFRGQACRAPTIRERISIADFEKHSPALDTDYFAKESGWEWTSTVDASSPQVLAWYVVLGGGNCGRDFRSGHGLVRPVLSSQSFGFEL